MNELLRVPFDFCVPTVKVEIEKVQCIDFKGRENHVLLMHIEPSMEVHANQADEVFMRVGNKSKKLAFEERMQLMYDKGERFFEDKPVPEADIEDIDLAFVEKYIAQIGYSKTAMEYLRENKGFIKEKMGKCRKVLRQYCYSVKIRSYISQEHVYVLFVMKGQKNVSGHR